MVSNVDALKSSDRWLLKGYILTYEYHSCRANSSHVVHSCGRQSDLKVNTGQPCGASERCKTEDEPEINVDINVDIQDVVNDQQKKKGKRNHMIDGLESSGCGLCCCQEF